MALTDQDNGHFRQDGDTFTSTYPRPWFGWVDESLPSPRLYPWGGYDKDLSMRLTTTADGDQTGSQKAKDRYRTKNGREISHTGFYYEGYDGIITGCVNPTSRIVLDDTNKDGAIVLTAQTNYSLDTLTTTYKLWEQGSPRPLINGKWGDFLILFRPDGTVEVKWMNTRREFARQVGGGTSGNVFEIIDPTWTAHNNSNISTSNRAIPDLSSKTVGVWPWWQIEHGMGDMTCRYQQWDVPGCYVKRTGYYWITLGPDMLSDSDEFSSAADALRKISPLYRVGVSPFGDVRIIRVRTTLVDGSTATFDDALTGNKWGLVAETNKHWRGDTLVNVDGSLRGHPVYDHVLPEMMAQRKWWWQ